MNFLSKTTLFGAVAGLAVAVIAPSADAASYTFDVRVTESQDAVPSPSFDLPDVGSLGTITFLLDSATLDADADPLTGINVDPFALDTSLAGASASIGGLTSELEAPNVFSFSNGARFSNGSFSNIAIDLVGANCATLGCTLAGSFSVSKVGAAEPVLFADVEALLMDPTALKTFSFNGTVQGESVSFRAESIAAVPVPAAGVLLMGGLGALALRRGARR